MNASFTNLGNRTGSVAPGDEVVCGGFDTVVTRVTITPPGHSDTCIRSDYTLVTVETPAGNRYLGALEAHIGADLRVHWSR